MSKPTNIVVKEVSVRTLKVNGTDYISISDIAKQKTPIEPKDIVKNWMRLKNTLEYLGLWEQLNNPSFKWVEFDPLFRGIMGSGTINRLIATDFIILQKK